MARAISATEARVHFGEVVRSANETNEPIFIEKAGKEVAVLLSPAEYRRLTGTDKKEDWWELVLESQRLFAKNRKPGIEMDVAELIRADREERDAQFDETLR